MPSGNRGSMRRYKSVLIVDDDADVRESISDVLSFAGHPNIVAADGMEALAALERCETPTLVLLDSLMPRWTARRFWRSWAAWSLPRTSMSCSSQLAGSRARSRPSLSASCGSPSTSTHSWPSSLRRLVATESSQERPSGVKVSSRSHPLLEGWMTAYPRPPWIGVTLVPGRARSRRAPARSMSLRVETAASWASGTPPSGRTGPSSSAATTATAPGVWRRSR